MRKISRSLLGLLLVVLGVGTTSYLSAVPIYRNSTNDLVARFDPGTLEIGDEILLAGTERYLTNFSFEFFGTNTANPFAFSGSINARVRFYQTNGPPFNGYNQPGAIPFFDSGLFPVSSPTSRSTFVFENNGIDLPTSGLFIPDSDIVWSVQFSGMGATDSVGVDLYSPPTVGQPVPNLPNPQDYWLNNGSSWVLQTNVVAMNFGATFDASLTPVPEPSVLILSSLGGFGILAFVRRSRGKA